MAVELLHRNDVSLSEASFSRLVEESEIRDWVIYKITNPNGRIYIGKSCNFTARLKKYKYSKIPLQKALSRSLNKYGFDSHKIEVIDSFRSDSNSASGKEIFWIRSFMSNVVKYPNLNGMNLTDGGEGTIGSKRSLESRLKTSLSTSGKPKKFSHRKYNIPRKRKNGYKHSEETKNKIRDRIKSLGLIGHLDNKSKSIIVHSLNGGVEHEFSSIKKAAKELGIGYSYMKRCLCNNKIAKGYTIKYK